MRELESAVIEQIKVFQRNEITEYHIYRSIARAVKDDHNRGVLDRIAEEELKHYNVWKEYSGAEVLPDTFKKWVYIVIARLFGLSFCIKLLERGENDAQDAYDKVSGVIPEAADIRRQEEEHEDSLVNMVEEERLAYMGSVVLGLNDALVEFTGALAGFTFALRESGVIGMVGLIMGFSASLSMAASEYLSTKTEDGGKDPVKAAFYTGMAYVVTVVMLVVPYFAVHNPYLSLFMTLVCAVILILAFTFYYSVVQGIGFRERFMEMLVVSMGVAALSFVIGLIVRKVLNVDI